MRTIRNILLTLTVAAITTSASFAKTGNPKNNDPKVPRTLAVQYNGYARNAVGVRAIGTTGITFKHFNGQGSAFEGILGFGYNSFSITGLSEKYTSAFESDFVDLYYGFGGHAVFGSNSGFGTDRNRFDDADDDFGLGVDFIVGLEMLIPDTPIALSIDVKPFFEVATSGNAYIGLDPGFGIKVMF